jgi:hypothetical protein
LTAPFAASGLSRPAAAVVRFDAVLLLHAALDRHQHRIFRGDGRRAVVHQQIALLAVLRRHVDRGAPHDARQILGRHLRQRRVLGVAAEAQPGRPADGRAAADRGRRSRHHRGRSAAAAAAGHQHRASKCGKGGKRRQAAGMRGGGGWGLHGHLHLLKFRHSLPKAFKNCKLALLIHR